MLALNPYHKLHAESQTRAIKARTQAKKDKIKALREGTYEKTAEAKAKAAETRALRPASMAFFAQASVEGDVMF